MAIRLRKSRNFGPFTQLADQELPDFVVLTGENGSGKTQLLTAVANGSVVADIDGIELKTKDVLHTRTLEPRLELRFQYERCIEVEQNAIPSRRRAAKMPGLDSGEAAKRLASQVLGKSPEALLEDEIRAF